MSFARSKSFDPAANYCFFTSYRKSWANPERSRTMSVSFEFTRKLSACFAVVLLGGVGSCRDWPPTQPPPSSVTLAVCPTDQSLSASGLIGFSGGTVSLGGTSVLLPLGALLSSTDIELTIPASQYMEIGVTANGGSIQFLRAITITMDYSRCSTDVQQKQLSVWHIDETTKEPLESMGGIDNKLTHQITFTTTHLSGYALAY
jgi:hypothetical protein